MLSARALLTAFLLSLTRDLELAEGIFQDLCVAVTEGREELDPDAAGFDARLRALARRRAFAVLRARGIDASGLPPERLVDRVEAIVAELSATPAERWTRRKDALRECLHALPAHLRQVVDLRYVQNLSVGQIAARLGHESQHVHAALERARRHLSECLRRRAAAAEEGA
ncbi:MAG: sigma-70 family RNA polymerase sigma factor [Planctomycetota bacterium]|nr:sigma-70 family RNA polymerase sigma factor [Planctomycetota bacterium]